MRQADAYDRHVGRYGRELAEGLTEVAGVATGQRALDVGCGPGALTTVLAERGATVAAIDPSEAFVEECRRRVPGADVRVGSAERLPFPDARFDAVLAQLVLNLVPEPAVAGLEMARVARPGGVVAACVWDAARMPLLRAFWEAAAKVAPEATAAVAERARVGYARAQQLADGLAGLRDVQTGDLAASAEYADFDELWAPFEAGVGRSGSLYAALDERERGALREEAFQLLGRPDGALRLTAHAWYARGIR